MTFLRRRHIQSFTKKRKLYEEVGSMVDNIRCVETRAEWEALQSAVEGATGMSESTRRKCYRALEDALVRISEASK